MAKLVLPTSTSSLLPTIATSSSRWNYKTVAVILGLAAVGCFLYKVFERYILTNSASTKKNPLPPLVVSPATRVAPVKGSSVPFTTGLSYENQPCINELAKPAFKGYASGIIRFDLNSFGGLKRYGLFNIACKDHTGAVFFKTCAIACEGNLDFFIANLPFGEEIAVELEKSRESIKLNIGQIAGLYTIRENDADDGLNYESALLGSSKVLAPLLVKEPRSLEMQFLLPVDGDGNSDASFNIHEKHLTIYNSRKGSIIYILLVSNNPAILAAERAIAFPVVMNDLERIMFSLSSLEDLWGSQYKHATGKDRPNGDLQLHLGGYHQIVYSKTHEHL